MNWWRFAYHPEAQFLAVETTKVYDTLGFG